MNAADTMVALALRTCDTRAELLEVAAALCAFASVAHAAGHRELRDRLVERAAAVLEVADDRPATLR
jgi:hypothetical protein